MRPHSLKYFLFFFLFQVLTLLSLPYFLLFSPTIFTFVVLGLSLLRHVGIYLWARIGFWHVLRLEHVCLSDRLLDYCAHNDKRNSIFLILGRRVDFILS